jgi:endo-1,4-beta-xylanase
MPRQTSAARCAAVLAALPLLAASVLPVPGASAAPTPQNTRAESTAKVSAANQDLSGRRLTLRQAAPRDLKIGTAVAGGGHHETMPYPDPFPNDREYRRILAAEFNSVSPENQMKWEFIHPERGTYRFGPADAIVAFARRHNQVVRGHTLLWHSQNPAWLEQGDFTPRQLRRILRNHIETVVGRYRGRIHQWDVANEIFNEQGVLRQENIWIRELGPGIIADAFRWAHRADPKAKLFFNDYGVESINAKSNAYYALVQDLLADGVPVHGFSVQGHLSLRYGFPNDLGANLQRFDDLGLDTAVTEVDVRMDLPASGTPTQAQLEQQADYYRRALLACLGVDDCTSFTVWGFTDKYSWVPVFFPTEGAATIMWEDFRRKPAYYALRNTLAEASRRGVTDQIITRTQARGKVVSLTFDDGPDREDTPRLLAVLRRHNVKAVFCLWGDHVRQYPNLVRRIARDGHTLCNHTMRHDDLSQKSQRAIRADLLATNELIRRVVPKARIPYFRAPYGSWGASNRVAAQLGMQPLGWTFAVEDWEEPGAEVLLDRLRDRLEPRSIVLLHDGGGDRSGTVEAVDEFIPELKAKGWRFVQPSRRD